MQSPGSEDQTYPQGAVDIPSFINERALSGFQLRVVVLCFVVAMVDGFDTQAVAFVAPVVSAEMSFGPQGIGNLYSAGLFGLMLGALTFGALADRIGRKPVIIVSCLLMGLFSLLCATSGSLNELLTYRFLTGLGIGAAMPNINALTAEYSPSSRQAVLMTAMFAGFPFGAVVGGMISVPLIGAFGWQSVFVLGGVVPLLLVVVLALILPESLRYRATRPGKGGSIGGDLRKIDPSWEAPAGASFVVEEAGSGKASKTPIFELFTQHRAVGTVAIWLLYFANLLMMYSLLGWLPTVISAAGLGLAGGIYTAVAFNAGGIVGGLTFAWTIDRQLGYWPLSAGYALAAVVVALVGTLGGSLSWALVVIFLCGLTLMGGAFALNAVTAAFYPTTVRSTGLGWGLAIGRLGAIFGPMAIGAALAAERGVTEIFVLVAAPGIFCAVGILWLSSRIAKMRSMQVTEAAVQS